MKKRIAWASATLTLLALAGACSGNDHEATGSAAGAAGAAGAATAAAGGGAGEPASVGGAGEPALSRFQAWSALRDAVRSSPDHLPARAAKLVKAADAQGLFELVRDEIVTYPPEAHGFGNIMTAGRWGAQATLRGGAGTPREKADLLLELYRAAGFEAQLLTGTADPARLTGEKALLRPVPRDFAPAIEPDQLAAWKLAWGQASPPERQAIDADGTKSQQLFEELLSQLPAEHEAAFDFTLAELPLVGVEVEGKTVYANVIAPEAAFGEALTLAAPKPYKTPISIKPVRIRLEAARSDAPRERFRLLDAEYAAADLVGRTLQLSFPPPVPFHELVNLRARDIEAVLPSLSIIDPNLTQEEQARLSFAGNVVTVAGDVYEIDDAGGVTLNGAPLPELTADPAAIERVSALEARVDAAGYPRVELTVSATDVEGEPVSRLGVPAFNVTDGGAPVSFSLTRVEPPQPRVILIFDASSSVPAEYRDAGAVQIGSEIVDALYAAQPEAQVRVGTINFGFEGVTSGWATSLAEAREQVALVEGRTGASEIFAAVTQAQEKDPTLVIMISDGDSGDEEYPRATAEISAGAPVLSLNVSGVSRPALERIAELSGGTTLAVTQQSEVVTAALTEIERQSRESYVISYSAPPGAAGAREVTVSVNGLTQSVSYEAPETPALPRALSGLYLTVELGGRSVTRTIAGLAEGNSSAFPELSDAQLADVRSALLGRTLFNLEGAAPTAAVVLDDWLTDKLATEPLWQAVEGADDAGISAALQGSRSTLRGSLALAHSPLPDAVSAESLTFETAPRIAISVYKMPDGRNVTRTLDLFPLSQWSTAAADATLAFEKTLRATAVLAIHEAELFKGGSTYEELAGAPLSLQKPSEVDGQVGLTASQRLQWTELAKPFDSSYRLLAPLEPGSFWAVHLDTGTVLGILDDGGAGGREDLCAQYRAADNALKVMAYAGGGGWAAVGQWEVKNLTMAMLVMFYGEPYNGLHNIGLELACSEALDGLGEHIPYYESYQHLRQFLEDSRSDRWLPPLPSPCSPFSDSRMLCGG